MTHLQSIDEGLSANRPHTEIVRKIYLTYPTAVLVGDEERQFKILNQISEYFQIPIIHIQVVGSAKTGYSFHQKATFIRLHSDLDIAIIDSNLFQHYTEWVFNKTNGLSDRTEFASYDGQSNYPKYIQYISKGIFRPDLMPSGNKRLNWFKFFGKLSTDNKDLFKSINAGIYLSQTFFEFKQTSNINEYILTKTI